MEEGGVCRILRFLQLFFQKLAFVTDINRRQQTIHAPLQIGCFNCDCGRELQQSPDEPSVI
jgi:hypothetical protein